MTGIDDIIFIEKDAKKNSPIHNLDPRVKLIIFIFLVVYAVHTQSFYVLIALELYLFLLIFISKLDFITFLKRLLLVLPFGGFIAIFQIFIRPGHILLSLPLGIHITFEGLVYGTFLLLKLITCVTSVLMLSSTTPLQDLVEAGKRLHLPPLFMMLISITVRYLFYFYEKFVTITNAQKSRCFSIWNKNLPYLLRLRKIGETIAIVFLKAYEQGEKVYLSMLSRGYNEESISNYHTHVKLKMSDYIFIISNVALVLFLEIVSLFII
ncbi:cobalt ABC transporter, inner membrane subunit CbiQ [Methanothermus fervidus DSM 2088]|uniref:Cobalt ABC transporter, inner membrane subunit CbiQ n=1 Tax=Methanothermus fervidus (strain ATCC 43054 / DSM 2088 / JCM 10308 / V24 S) TaxID=523846 RepID=E3GZ64_METFV|nr:cobalt ECF transporter T component CbiQ [Methanothermus fervidus]ADP77596.1 cobalt ABC transporter, inner membrane subunit CbiQ [Methanothermus fervidus DSM 2088]